MDKQRIYYFDILRVIACLAVVMIHSSASYVTKNFGTFNFWVGNFFDSVSRIGVPLFVMISGSLLLDENYECTPKKIRAHVFKMVVFFIFWSVAYSVVFNLIYPLISHENVDIKSIISSILIGHYHLWFCFMIVGLYLITPLLRLWIKKENKRYIEYFLLLTFVFSFFLPQIVQVGSYYSPLFESANKILDNINIKYVMGYTSYFVLGWYIHNFDLKNTRLIYIFGILGLVITFIGTYILSITLNEPVQLYGNNTVNVLAQSSAVFMLVKQCSKGTKIVNNSIGEKVITFISKNSLGIYAIHAVLVDLVYRIFGLLRFDIVLVIVPAVFLFAFAGSLFASWIMSKIPYLKKIV